MTSGAHGCVCSEPPIVHISHTLSSVSSMQEDASDRLLTFLVKPVVMRDIVKSFGVTYNHNGASVWNNGHVRDFSPRDEHGFDDVYNFGFNPDLASRLPLFPPNSTIDDGVSEALLRYVVHALTSHL